MRGRDDDGSFSPLAGADVAPDTMEPNGALVARGSVLQSEIGMASMEGRDGGTRLRSRPPFSSAALSLVGPCPNCGWNTGSPPKTCWLHDRRSAGFKCGLWFSQVASDSSEFSTSQRLGLTATCVFREGVCTFRLKFEKLESLLAPSQDLALI